MSVENEFSANLSLSNKWEKECLIGEAILSVEAYGMGCSVAIYANVSVNGEVTLSYDYSSVNGFDYSSSDGFQLYGNVGTYFLENEELKGDQKTDISAIKESIVEKQNTK